MNRRSFFLSLSSAVAGCYLALQVKLPKVEPVPDNVRTVRFFTGMKTPRGDNPNLWIKDTGEILIFDTVRKQWELLNPRI